MTWQPKSSLTVETSHWTSSNMDSVPLHTSSRLWDLDFQMKCKIYFNLKRGLWTTEQQSSSFSLFSPGKILLTMFLFLKWLGSPFPEDVWAWWLLTPASVNFLWSFHKCLNRLCLTVFSSLRSSLLLVHLFLSNFFLPVNFAICFDTALCEEPPLSLMTLCDLPSLWMVSKFVFWIIAKSAVFPIIVVSKNKRYPEFINWYCRDGRLMAYIYIYIYIYIYTHSGEKKYLVSHQLCKFSHLKDERGL